MPPHSLLSFLHPTLPPLLLQATKCGWQQVCWSWLHHPCGAVHWAPSPSPLPPASQQPFWHWAVPLSKQLHRVEHNPSSHSRTGRSSSNSKGRCGVCWALLAGQPAGWGCRRWCQMGWVQLSGPGGPRSGGWCWAETWCAGEGGSRTGMGRSRSSRLPVQCLGCMQSARVALLWLCGSACPTHL